MSGGAQKNDFGVLHERLKIRHGADTDIIVASAKAYINALNKLIVAQTERRQPVQTEYGVMLG